MNRLGKRNKLLVDLNNHTMEYIVVNPTDCIQMCRQCDSILPMVEFYKSTREKTGFSTICKICANANHSAFSKTPKGKLAKARQDKKYAKSEMGKAAKKRDHQKHDHNGKMREYYRSEKGQASRIRYMKSDRYKELEKGRRGSEKAKLRARQDIISGKGKERHRIFYQRHKADPQYRLNSNISWHIGYSLNGHKNNRHWEDLVGFTRKQLMLHLEQQFTDGMPWENYGKGGWAVDHIIPLAAFHYTDYTDPDFKRCWALSNLRPLWEKDNYKKRDTLIKPFQPSLDLLRKPKQRRIIVQENKND